MTSFIDPIEQRDVWRTAWQIIDSDAFINAIVTIVVLGLLAVWLLPQSPSAGTADPITYSQWDAQARLREGAIYEPLVGLGFNAVFQSVWWRIALMALGVVALTRLFDRVGRLLTLRGPKDSLIDESRIRIVLDGPALSLVGERLRARRLRVSSAHADSLIADTWPRAEAVSAILHAGMVLAVAGMLTNLVFGWDVTNRSLVPGTPVTLNGATTLALTDAPNPTSVQAAMLQPANTLLTLMPNGQVTSSGVSVRLRQITPGYRVSASTLAGKTLPIRASNFVSPTQEVLVAFTEQEMERYLAVPDARMALALSLDTGPGLDAQARVRVFALPSGNVISDTLIQPQIVLSDTRFVFAPARGAVIDAAYRPGDGLVWMGLPFALLGLLGTLVFPMRRIVVRHHGHWTEFYATGRAVRRIINELIG